METHLTLIVIISPLFHGHVCTFPNLRQTHIGNGTIIIYNYIYILYTVLPCTQTTIQLNHIEPTSQVAFSPTAGYHPITFGIISVSASMFGQPQIILPSSKRLHNELS